jgi:hypothetical protein
MWRASVRGSAARGRKRVAWGIVSSVFMGEWEDLKKQLLKKTEKGLDKTECTFYYLNTQEHLF